ncbi:MAG: hypothetical protein L6V93_06550 [Clostridiales bacterium]|nr:MAG: hypothetical protein L6V93_06550 [Clostridiales bacterium]
MKKLREEISGGKLKGIYVFLRRRRLSQRPLYKNDKTVRHKKRTARILTFCE